MHQSSGSIHPGWMAPSSSRKTADLKKIGDCRRRCPNGSRTFSLSPRSRRFRIAHERARRRAEIALRANVGTIVDIPGLRAASTSRWLDPVLFACLLIAAVVVYVPTAARVGYNTDEGQFIAASEYFDIAFLKHELTGPNWAPNYYTLTQPMLSRFILGAGIRFAGLTPPPLDIHHREADVNPATRGRYLERETYRDERRLAEERRIDRPSNAQLQAARAPMILLSTLAGRLALRHRSRASPGPWLGWWRLVSPSGIPPC